MLTETDIQKLPLCRLRYEEAKHFLQEFIRYCSPPCDQYFGMIASFDAFLFCFVSIEELVDSPQKAALNKTPIFRFMKAARDVTTHHSILAAPDQAKFDRPFSRHMTDGPGGSSARLKVEIARFLTVFADVKKEPKANKHTLTDAEQYLKSLAATGQTNIYLEDVLAESLAEVAKLLCFS